MIQEEYLFRATYWIQRCEDDSISRHIEEFWAKDEFDFMAQIQDRYLNRVDDIITFGPISRKVGQLIENK